MKTIACLSLLLLIIGCQQEVEKTVRKFDRDRDGMLLIEGKRTFMIGTYHLPKSDSPYRTLRENGYNLIHVPANLEALDAAQENGLYTWLGTGSLRKKNQAEDEKRIKTVITRFKEHPSLLLWEIADEPAFTWHSPDYRVSPEQMIKTYQLIKKEDPDHLVYTNHGPVNLISTLRKYNAATDIIACDIYPVIPHGIKPTYALFDDGLQGDLLNPYLSQVGEYTDKMMQVSEGNLPLFMVLQGFSWEMLKDEKDRDMQMILYPTYEQSRFMAYNAIIHGATGINYWGTSYTPQPSPFMESLNRLTRELAEMQAVLAAPVKETAISKEYHEMGHSIDTGVEYLAKEAGGVFYLLTANADKNPVKVTFSGLKNFSEAIVLKENRKIEIKSGSFTDDYQRFDVHVYQFE